MDIWLGFFFAKMKPVDVLVSREICPSNSVLKKICFICGVYEEWSINLSSSSEDKQSLIHKGGGVGEDGVQVSSNKVIEFIFGIGVSSKL